MRTHVDVVIIWSDLKAFLLLLLWIKGSKEDRDVKASMSWSEVMIQLLTLLPSSPQEVMLHPSIWPHLLWQGSREPIHMKFISCLIHRMLEFWKYLCDVSGFSYLVCDLTNSQSSKERTLTSPQKHEVLCSRNSKRHRSRRNTQDHTGHFW